MPSKLFAFLGTLLNDDIMWFIIPSDSLCYGCINSGFSSNSV